jgi:hypothetical protein
LLLLLLLLVVLVLVLLRLLLAPGTDTSCYHDSRALWLLPVVSSTGSTSTVVVLLVLVLYLMHTASCPQKVADLLFQVAT